jgi:hypothetical protein
MNEHDTVVLTRSFPEHRLTAGDVGAIVNAYPTGDSYEVEFVSGSGATVALLTLVRSDVRPMSADEMLHVRAVPA